MRSTVGSNNQGTPALHQQSQAISSARVTAHQPSLSSGNAHRRLVPALSSKAAAHQPSPADGTSRVNRRVSNARNARLVSSQVPVTAALQSPTVATSINQRPALARRKSNDTDEDASADNVYHQRGPAVYGSASGSTRIVLRQSGSLRKLRPRQGRGAGLKSHNGSTDDPAVQNPQLYRLKSSEVDQLIFTPPTALDSRNFRQVADAYGPRLGSSGAVPRQQGASSSQMRTANRAASGSASSHQQKSAAAPDRSARRVTGAQFRSGRLRQARIQRRLAGGAPATEAPSGQDRPSQAQCESAQKKGTTPTPGDAVAAVQFYPKADDAQDQDVVAETGGGQIEVVPSHHDLNQIEQQQQQQPLIRVVKPPEQRFRRRLVAIAQAQQDKMKTINSSQQKTRQIMTQSTSQLTAVNAGGAPISNQNKASQQKFQYLSKSEERATHGTAPAGTSEHLKMVGAINIQSTRNNNNEYNFATQQKADGRLNVKPNEFQIKLQTQAASQGSARRMQPGSDVMGESVPSARGAAAKDEMLLKQGLNSVRTMAGATAGSSTNKRDINIGGHGQKPSDSHGGNKLVNKMSPRMQLQQITEANTRPFPDQGNYGTQPKSAQHNATLNVGAALKQMQFQQPQTVKNANGQTQQISIRRLPPQQHSNASSRMNQQQNTGARRMGEVSVDSTGNAAPTTHLLQQHPSAGSLQKYGGSFDRDRSDSREQKGKHGLPTQNYNRRRQQLQQADGATDTVQFKILKPLPNQGVPSSNTMDPQMLAHELKYASLQTTPGQQAALVGSKKVQAAQNQVQLVQAAQRAKAVNQQSATHGANSQRFSTAVSKISSSRKPSRGNLLPQREMQNQQQQQPGGNTKTKIKLTQLNKIVFSTPGLLSNDPSQGNLNAPQQQNNQQSATVIFHPHPLNEKSRGAGPGSGAMTAAIAQKISAAQQTPQMHQQQQEVLYTAERPHSQKQVAVSAINNRNSRKNFRPMAKKTQVGSQGRERPQPQVGHGSLMLRHRTDSGEGTDRRHHQASGSTQPVSAVLGAVLGGHQQRGAAMDVPHLVQVHTEASASTSRERALAALQNTNKQPVNHLGQSLQLNLNLNQAAAKENYQTSQGAYMNVKDQQHKNSSSAMKGQLAKKVKAQYQSTPGQQTMQRTQQLVLKYNHNGQQPMGPLFQQQPSTKNSSSLISVNQNMQTATQGQTRTLPTSSRYNQKINFQHTQPLQGLGMASQQVQDGIMSQRQSQQNNVQKRRVGKINEGASDAAGPQGGLKSGGSNSQQKLSSLALNFNTASQPGGVLAPAKNGSQMNFMASQTLDLGALGNLNDLSSLNENATAAAGLSSFSAIENLLMAEDASQLSNKNSGIVGTNLNMYNSQDALPIANGIPKDKLPSKLSYVTSQAQSARASQVKQNGAAIPTTGSGRLVKGSTTGGGSKLGSKRASKLQLNVNASANYHPGGQGGQAPVPATNPSTTKWSQQKGRHQFTDGVLNSLTGTFEGQKNQMAQTQRIQLHGHNQVGPKAAATLQRVMGTQASSAQSLKATAAAHVQDHENSQAAIGNQTVYGGGTIGTTNGKKEELQKTTIGSAPEADFGNNMSTEQKQVIDENQRPMQVDEAENPADEEEQQQAIEDTAADNYNDSQALSKEQNQADTQPQRLQKSAAVMNLAQPAQVQLLSKGKTGGESGTKTAGQQRTTMDTNSQRKQQTTTSDSQQRTNFNTSMQNIPRGLINTAFSLSSVASRGEEHTTPRPALPTTPQNILKFYIHELTDYEKGEVLDYETIYFLGKSREKKVDKNYSGDASTNPGAKKTENKSPSSADKKKEGAEEKKDDQIYNYGYDDEKGDYKVVIGDHIGYRYEIVEFLGKGSFGTALGCIDHKEKREVAVKIVKNKKKYYYQASVELKILQYLRQHDHEDIMNVIHIEDYVVFRKHLCMSFERLSMNLFEFLKINDFNGFDHNLIRRFAIQLLYALKYLKQLEIIHCDLKPENILLKEENKSGIKIIDFGSSTFIDEKVYTYIQSRFYRAPEIMLGIPYTTAIDMWSLGCIMAELYIGYPLFPGESENDQMSRIMEMRDVPPNAVLRVSERKMKFFTQNKTTNKLEPVMLKNSRGKLRKPNGKPLDYVIGDEDEDFNDFVARCLDWNPETRLTPDEALKHVWVLKGLPPQVLIHHQKMHNIQTPELPVSVKEARDEFITEQQREQELLMLRQNQSNNQSRDSRSTRSGVAPREISQNPNTIQRPAIQLKTPRQAGLANNAINLVNKSQKRNDSEYASQVQAVGQIKGMAAVNNQVNQSSQQQSQQPSAMGSGRKKFVIKK